MKPDWYLIANATHARVLGKDGGSPMYVAHAFNHEDSRKRTAELGDDKAGREASDQGFGGSAFEPRMDAHRKEHLRFAREIGQWLEEAARTGRFRSLTLFASNPFLGELKQALGTECARLLAGTHPTDLSAVGLAEAEARIAEAHP
ncbi:host attachment protein [Caenimonas aquaedulcis]|uniref:Host attachment protein n=1 Tax=Caenimonas aquaedulcis TaxID=2793270 RepID=A0A931MIZ7_9BURK|nr:host attachment protein [Caenimonas aquaedulcis]MBG9390243.1 host attachment protein [Caenimonas aquaedulcis]